MKAAIRISPDFKAVLGEFEQGIESLANSLNIPVIKEGQDISDYSMIVEVDKNGLSLLNSQMPKAKPVKVDFTSGKFIHRSKSGKKQLIARAIGLNSRLCPHVLDATAGLGTDSFTMASLGCTVQMTERVPLIATLLKDGITRALADDKTREIAERLSFSHSSAVDWIENNPDKRPDVVYMDPMFPERTKSSLVKKESRMLRSLAGDDEDAHILLDKAIDFAEYRVVVKRPRKAPTLEGPVPTYVIEGKIIRYDIYVMKGMHNIKS